MTSSLIITGDIVRLRTGESLIRVSEVRYTPITAYRQLRGRYVNSGIDVDWRDCNDFIRFKNPVNNTVTEPVCVMPLFKDVAEGVVVQLQNYHKNLYYKYVGDTLYWASSWGLCGSYGLKTHSGCCRLTTRISRIVPENEIPKALRERKKNSWDDYVFVGTGFSFDYGTSELSLPLEQTHANRAATKRAAQALIDWIDAGCPPKE